jgi:hypothetical protein
LYCEEQALDGLNFSITQKLVGALKDMHHLEDMDSKGKYWEPPAQAVAVSISSDNNMKILNETLK